MSTESPEVAEKEEVVQQNGQADRGQSRHGEVQAQDVACEEGADDHQETGTPPELDEPAHALHQLPFRGNRQNMLHVVSGGGFFSMIPNLSVEFE